MGDQRPGDNLYTSSVLALAVNSGAIKGYRQYHPNDSWDWDEVSPPILVDYRHNGKTIKGLVDGPEQLTSATIPERQRRPQLRANDF